MNNTNSNPKPMKNHYTDLQLIQFQYGELSSFENRLIKEQSAKDWKLKERLNALRLVHTTLNAVHFQPSQSSINIIMQHSRKGKKLEASI